jgi:regulator of protease activity HflC (stomatin/prohibitin superfamily)
MLRILAVLALGACSGCATVIAGHERALYYSASGGMNAEPVGPGWHWHLPWNGYLIYDLRWTSHKEDIHIHSRDGLHMDLDVVVVVRPQSGELFALDTDVGPAFYDELVKPAVYAATRDASSHFTHAEIATNTHSVEHAIQEAMIEHLRDRHIEISEVAIQHFDLTKEVEEAADKKAANDQMLVARETDLKLAQRDAEVAQARKRGQLDAEALEKRLHAEQAMAEAQRQFALEEVKRKSEKERVEAEAEQGRIRAQGEADATRIRAEAEKARIRDVSANLTPSYVKLKSIEALAQTLSAGNTRIMVLPTGKDGLPAYFGPFLNPYGPGALSGADKP